MGRGFSTCPRTGKRRHPTLASARKTIHDLAGRQAVDTGVGPLRAYCCPFCGWFHIGHSTAEVLERPKRSS
jgi:hypothetical protein